MNVYVAVAIALAREATFDGESYVGISTRVGIRDAVGNRVGHYPSMSSVIAREVVTAYRDELRRRNGEVRNALKRNEQALRDLSRAFERT